MLDVGRLEGSIQLLYVLLAQDTQWLCHTRIDRLLPVLDLLHGLATLTSWVVSD